MQEISAYRHGKFVGRYDSIQEANKDLESSDHTLLISKTPNEDSINDEDTFLNLENASDFDKAMVKKANLVVMGMGNKEKEYMAQSLRRMADLLEKGKGIRYQFNFS